MAIYTLGSINIDATYRVTHLPAPGETLAAHSVQIGLGGKGANQSVAAARAGSEVTHIGAIGPDGDAVLDQLAGFGVDTSQVARLDIPTGIAMIFVDESGENSIVLLSSANQAQDDSTFAAALSAATADDTLLLQNETNGQRAAARLARDKGMRVIYSAAPFDAEKVAEMLPFTSVLLLNEVEAAALETELNRSIADLGLPHVVVTRGASGAIHTEHGTATAYPSLKVTPVDTTGAGDTFAGYLAAGLDQGLRWADALPLALAAAALATTKPGTAIAIPGRSEVEAARA